MNSNEVLDNGLNLCYMQEGFQSVSRSMSLLIWSLNYQVSAVIVMVAIIIIQLSVCHYYRVGSGIEHLILLVVHYVISNTGTRFIVSFLNFPLTK